MKGYRFFKRYFSNFAIIFVIVSLFCLGFSSSSVPAVATNSPIYKGNSQTEVSLMVNVYWGNEYLDEMLEIFDNHEIKTTFFIGGSWARKNEDLLVKIVEKGHEIGNHGFFHKDHDKLSYKQNREEILATHNLIKSICGVDMNLFAPPSGAFDDETLLAVSDLNYLTIMWSKDTIDWRDNDPNLIFKRATRNIAGGDLVLMHPTAQTCKALDDIIVEIKGKGLQITTVSEVIDA